MEKTPKSWEEGTLPTPEQLADWLNVCTREERIYLAEIIQTADAYIQGREDEAERVARILLEFAQQRKVLDDRGVSVVNLSAIEAFANDLAGGMLS